MIPLSARINCIKWVDEAVKNKARRGKACDVIGISIRTLQNWQKEGEVQADKRLTAVHPSPNHKLTAIEREEILRVCNEPLYANLPPSQIVPMLADQGRYIASESTFYRVLSISMQFFPVSALTLSANKFIMLCKNNRLDIYTGRLGRCFFKKLEKFRR